ncbi:hypothetical protein BASA83_010906 [Batrachochytrium salamandrivorans]|nr:hypothetical protein BASA83_010906 [Batrachochytrium salamandrivorans]
MKQSHHETPHEEQQSTESPPDEDDASPSMTNVHQETPRTHSSAPVTNQWKKLPQNLRKEREKGKNSSKEKVRNPADRELLRNKCAQLRCMHSYKLAFYMLRLFERTMSELEKVESGKKQTRQDLMTCQRVLCLWNKM